MNLKYCTKLFLICIYFNSCFRYEISEDVARDRREEKLLNRDQNKYCYELSYKIGRSTLDHPAPSTYTDYAKCLESGYVIDAISNKKEIRVSPDATESLKMFQVAAYCRDQEAIAILQTKMQPIPNFFDRDQGEYIFPLFAKPNCGYREELTTLGYFLIVPIVIPVGVVLFVGAIITLPLCAVTVPLHDGSCM